MVDALGDILRDWLPFLLALGFLLALHRGVWWIFLRKHSLASERRLPRQLLTIAIALVGVVVLVVLIPVNDSGLFRESTKGDLLSLLGLAITALLTLSSTTLAANAMAGLMLRMEHSYRPGDFVRVGEHFGRITERGLFHTEIQTEDRDLITFPNMHLATNPIRIVRSTGTIISAEVSLGYDVAHSVAEQLLVRAATAADLTDGYVWITDLKDHAVVYRVCGFLEDPRTLVSARSKLRVCVLDALHGARVEIVSPTYMAQRPAPKDEPVIPMPTRARPAREDAAPERIVFDKAEAASQVEQLNRERADLEAKKKEIEQGMKEAAEEDKVERTGEIEQYVARMAEIDEMIESLSPKREGAASDS
jgi:small-conductance mechanosensitive channel